MVKKITALYLIFKKISKPKILQWDQNDFIIDFVFFLFQRKFTVFFSAKVFNAYNKIEKNVRILVLKYYSDI